MGQFALECRALLFVAFEGPPQRLQRPLLGGKGGVQDAMLMGSVEVAQIAPAKFKVKRGPSSERGARASPAPSLVPRLRACRKTASADSARDPPGSLRDQPRAWMLPTRNHNIFYLLFGVQSQCHHIQRGCKICMPRYFEIGRSESSERVVIL